MMVRYLFVICNVRDVWYKICFCDKQHLRLQGSYNGKRRGFHFLGKILAVGSGIGNELRFIELLRIIKSLLCRITVITVCFTL